MEWTNVADQKTLEGVAKALNERGFETTIVESKDDAVKRVVDMVPEGAEVLEATSATLQETGITDQIQNSGKFKSIRKELSKIEQKEYRDRMRRASGSAEYSIGSAQAITRDGQIVVASASGSQIAPYAYGAKNVILVVGAQKIVKDLDEAIKRVYEHTLPLESERVKKAYGMPKSSVNKILILEREMPGRIRVILVKEKLGF